MSSDFFSSDTPCFICNQKTGLNKNKTSYGYICHKCMSKLIKQNINILNIKKYTVDELKDKVNSFSENNIISYNERRIGMKYVVLQVVLKEKFIGTGSGNLTELEKVINTQAEKGYRLHTISTTSSGSKGLMGGDRIQATLVFEKL